VVSLPLSWLVFKGLQLNKHLKYFLVFCVIPVLVILWWWGMFASAQITEQDAPAYRYAYLEVEGPYSKLSGKQAEVLALLKAQKVNYNAPLTLMMSDPRVTQYKQRIARVGYIVTSDSVISAPLQVDSIPARRVLSAQVKAHPLFAYGKTYGALVKYCEQQGMGLQLPTVEIVEHSVLTVQMPLRKE
jgi:hypothetical protein